MIFSDGEGIGQNIFYQLYLLSIIITYYLWFWIKHNQTLGMKSWKSYIVNKDNKKELIDKTMFTQNAYSSNGRSSIAII